MKIIKADDQSNGLKNKLNSNQCLYLGKKNTCIVHRTLSDCGILTDIHYICTYFAQMTLDINLLRN